jgi:hypothetical protein
MIEAHDPDADREPPRDHRHGRPAGRALQPPFGAARATRARAQDKRGRGRGREGKERKGREGKERKGREGKEGKGREGKGREGKEDGPSPP